ncbi:odorant receptor 242 [Nasonia vitripennis]|uniref:Odorant receptor n=1 Tax=Nasonia vitripennis TaxID=7425 RepID=A0A7M6UGY2_NASVI|nr:odorant receptor 242 [Nasonia vitripennis]
MIMEKEVEKYKKYKSNLKFMIVSNGVWPDYEKHPYCVRKFLNFCSISSISMTNYCMMLFVIATTTDVRSFTSFFGLLLGGFGNLFKVCALTMNQKELHALNEGISASFERNLRVPENRPHLLANFPMFSKFFNFLSYSTLGTIGFLTVIPLLHLRHGTYSRMWPILLPFSYEPGGTIHWIIFVFELVVSFFAWITTCGVDCLFGLYSLHIVGEMRLLSSRFQKLEWSENYRKDIRSCVKSHLLLLKTLSQMQEAFGDLAVWFAFNSAASLCTLVFQFSQLTVMNPARVLYLLCHTCIKLVQAYSYSWYGNIITVESEVCLNAAYNSHWPNHGDKHFMRDVLIILLQRPMVFKAKSFIALRLDLFARIANTTLSYFFLLQTLDEKV